ncbi:MAG: queuosine precursor transporter [Lentisphaerae bacterium]|nr:queuosine precursor transporter [Lentisphaerota bacterium]
MTNNANLEIDYNERKVFMPTAEGHSQKIGLDFNNVHNSGALNNLDGKTAYNLGMCIGAFNTQNLNSVQLNHSFKLFNFLCVGYAILMIISNNLSLKLLSLGGFSIVGGFFVYPLTYILNFIISDVYGYKYARRCMQAVIIAFIFFIFSIILLLHIPTSEIGAFQQALNTLFSRQVRIFTASLSGFSISIFTSSYLLQKIKKRTQGRYLFVRVMSSLAVSEVFDIVIFCFIAFWGIWTFSQMIEFMVIAYLTRLLYEAILYPLITRPLIKKIKEIEKVDIVDINLSFNPLSLDVKYQDANNLYR